jgi:hypothetical protein
MYISDIHPDVVRRTVVTVLVIFEDRLSMAGVGWRGTQTCGTGGMRRLVLTDRREDEVAGVGVGVGVGIGIGIGIGLAWAAEGVQALVYEFAVVAVLARRVIPVQQSITLRAGISFVACGHRQAAVYDGCYGGLPILVREWEWEWGWG